MRATTFLSTLAVLVPLSLAKTINITKTDEVDEAAGTGSLGWGASDLAFGYSAGAGINFSSKSVGGGFNAGIPGQSEGALGGGWTLTADNLTFGLGGVYNNRTISIAVFGDKTTGTVTVTFNGKNVSLI